MKLIQIRMAFKLFKIRQTFAHILKIVVRDPLIAERCSPIAQMVRMAIVRECHSHQTIKCRIRCRSLVVVGL